MQEKPTSSPTDFLFFLLAVCVSLRILLCDFHRFLFFWFTRHQKTNQWSVGLSPIFIPPRISTVPRFWPSCADQVIWVIFPGYSEWLHLILQPNASQVLPFLTVNFIFHKSASLLHLSGAIIFFSAWFRFFQICSLFFLVEYHHYLPFPSWLFYRSIKHTTCRKKHPWSSVFSFTLSSPLLEMDSFSSVLVFKSMISSSLLWIKQHLLAVNDASFN